MPDEYPLTVFLVDDDASVRDSAALLLSLRGYRTALFANAEDFLRACQPSWTGCLVTDLRMPGISGLELQAKLLARGIALPVIVITAHGDVASARAAFRSAAVDFLQKPYDDDQLVEAIEAAFARERGRLALAVETQRRTQAVSDLSEREREVVRLMTRGLSHREIGQQLGISPRTVEAHKARLMRKLGVANLAELIRLAGDTEPAAVAGAPGPAAPAAARPQDR
jgi:FixJ family two-component response regulator